MSKHGLDQARTQLRERLRKSTAARTVWRSPEPPKRDEAHLLTTDQTCGSCQHRGSEVIGPSCKVALGYYRCTLRPDYEWQSPLASCRFEPSRYVRRA